MTIKREFFDQIKAGKKKEEYRLRTEYWTDRLKKNYLFICFRAGYDKNSPILYVEYLGKKKKMIKHPFFGDKSVPVFEIKLGKIVDEKTVYDQLI